MRLPNLKEFACGHSTKVGTPVIACITLYVSIFGLYKINLYYYEMNEKKVTGSDNAFLSLLMVDCGLGIAASVSGLYGAYNNSRIWIKSFLVYLLCQFLLVTILLWIFAILIFRELHTFPRRTRFIMLNIILFVTAFFGLLLYAVANIDKFRKKPLVTKSWRRSP